jgi:hypothetical protein
MVAPKVVPVWSDGLHANNGWHAWRVQPFFFRSECDATHQPDAPTTDGTRPALLPRC